MFLHLHFVKVPTRKPRACPELKFQYSGLTVTPVSSDLEAPLTVSFNVRNVGPREGAEVAEVYVGDTHSSVPRPAKELKGFAKVNLKPGESKRMSVKLDRRSRISA
ncbi:MAG: hypothetical protein DMG39_17940 [Acidobacteria bacterium]|nr:MAG: hypothetical protein DMG39_17940 [Acidobacteriota bacterium]